MFRQILRTLSCEGTSSRYFKRKYSDSNKNKTTNNDIAYEAEHYYKHQDKELLELLKQKMQEEVKCMQDEVTSMRGKIEQYTRDINEDLRFLKCLEKDLSASDKK